MNNSTLTVKQLNLYVRSLLEGDLRLSNVAVSGEISNFKNHYTSGHLYFTLKDGDASINCVMFRAYASRVKFQIENGMKVIIRGKVSIYERDGQYQLYAEEMLPEGIGDIALMFEQIKKKLQNEGLFDSANKRPLPKFPKRIAVVTSKTGAAVQDIINILTRRWPVAEIILCPVSVQGELAVPSMLNALDELYEKAIADVIIIGRGGGSVEDLWAFNSEDLARKIYESPVPVISAVGHETDFTICDFVADLRAPTPSAAAELCVPELSEFYANLLGIEALLKKDLLQKYNLAASKLLGLANLQMFKSPYEYFINSRSEEIDRTCDKLQDCATKSLEKAENKLLNKVTALDALSPLKALSRGFAAVKLQDKAITSIKDINLNDSLTLTFSDGSASCTVTNKKENNNA